MILGIGKATSSGAAKSSKTLKKLQASGFVYSEGGVLEFDAEKVMRCSKLKAVTCVCEEQEVPPLTLVRADGTTLYTTRDVAYTLWKFGRAEKVVNVIGMEQSLAQLQLKVALYALGMISKRRSFHFGYKLRICRVQDEQPSRTSLKFDEVLDEAVTAGFRRSYQNVRHT